MVLSVHVRATRPITQTVPQAVGLGTPPTIQMAAPVAPLAIRPIGQMDRPAPRLVTRHSTQTEQLVVAQVVLRAAKQEAEHDVSLESY